LRYLSYKEKRQHGTFNFPIAFYRIEPTHPRYRMILHWHFENEIIKVESGKLEVFVEGERYELFAGDILYVPGEALHSGIPHSCVYECIVFDLKMLLKHNNSCNSILKDFLNHDKQIDVQFAKKEKSLGKIINYLFLSMCLHKEGYEFVVQGILYVVLGIILEKGLFFTIKTPKVVSDRRLRQFKNILQYIEENYYEEISLAQLADIAGMDKKYFCSFFHDITGRPPIDYLNSYRIECACEQFLTTSFSVIDVGYNCGFHDASYFSKIFKKYKNITPREFIKQHGGFVNANKDDSISDLVYNKKMVN